MTNTFDFVLLDFGGVLIKLVGWEPLLAWSNFGSMDELKSAWLLTSAVQKFETGKCDEHTFARDVVRELALRVEPEEFLRVFEAWPDSLFPGVQKLLAELSANIPIVSVSNTSALHWKRFEKWNYLHFFHRHFASFELGVCKPNVEYFHRVLSELHVKPNRVLFCDDSVLNVDAAASVGIVTARTVGIEELSRVLSEFGLITSHIA